MVRACHIDKEILFQAFEEVYNSNHLTEGVMVKRFEEAAEHLYGLNAVSISNAGTALYTLMRLMPKKTGKVIVPNNTFFATGAMATQAGWQIVLADCGADFCLTLKTVEEAHAKGEVDGVILTHVGGPLAGDLREISEYCTKHDLFFIEDAAHAYGVKAGKAQTMAGHYSHAAVFSFYPTKAIPVGEGGLIVTKDKDLADKCRIFRNYGKYLEDGKVNYTGEGFNFRMDEWTAAVAWLQTERVTEIILRRYEIANKLMQVLPVHPAFEFRSTNWYKYVSFYDDGIVKKAGQVYAKSDQLAQSMGIGGEFTMCDHIAKNHICLPLQEGLYEGLSIDAIKDLLTGRA